MKESDWSQTWLFTSRDFCYELIVCKYHYWTVDSPYYEIQCGEPL